MLTRMNPENDHRGCVVLSLLQPNVMGIALGGGTGRPRRNGSRSAVAEGSVTRRTAHFSLFCCCFRGELSSERLAA